MSKCRPLVRSLQSLPYRTFVYLSSHNQFLTNKEGYGGRAQLNDSNFLLHPCTHISLIILSLLAALLMLLHLVGDIKQWEFEGVYTQSLDSLRLLSMGPSIPIKSKYAQWEHLSFTIFANFDVKKQLKLLQMAFNQDLTCVIFPLR